MASHLVKPTPEQLQESTGQFGVPLLLNVAVIRVPLARKLFQPPDERGARRQTLEQGVHEAGVAQIQQPRHCAWRKNICMVKGLLLTHTDSLMYLATDKNVAISFAFLLSSNRKKIHTFLSLLLLCNGTPQDIDSSRYSSRYAANDCPIFHHLVPKEIATQQVSLGQVLHKQTQIPAGHTSILP